MVVVEPVVHGIRINPEGKRATVDERLVVYGVKRLDHWNADLNDQIATSSFGSIQAASISATTPNNANSKDKQPLIIVAHYGELSIMRL